MLKRAEETNADSIVPDVEFGYGNTKKIPNLFKSNHLNGQTLIKDGKQAFDHDHSLETTWMANDSYLLGPNNIIP